MPLSEDQVRALENAQRAREAGKPETALTGCAGSGKTHCTSELIEYAQGQGYRIRMMAPTGRAALQLKNANAGSGLPEPTTLHRALFKRAYRDDDTGKLGFAGERNEIKEGDLVIVDEAYMVGRRMADRLRQQVPDGAWLHWMDDVAQLPPVKNQPNDAFDHPTGVLTKVHRQAEGSPIIDVSTRMRTGGRLPHGAMGSEYLRKRSSMQVVARWLHESEDNAIALCFANSLRRSVNAAVRQLQGRRRALEIGDRVACTANNYTVGAFNGELFDVIDLNTGNRKCEVLLRSADGREVAGEVVLNHIGAKDVPEWAYGRKYPNRVRLDYGHCVTVHKAQGSQWPRVCFMLDQAIYRRARSRQQEDRNFCRALVYTASTRAQEHLYVAEVA